MTEQSLSSVAPVAAHGPASAAVAERPEADDARARDAQLGIPGVDPNGDEAQLTTHGVSESRRPEWA